MSENLGSIYGEVKINDNTAEVIQHIDGLVDAMGNKVPQAAQKMDQGTKVADNALAGMGKTAMGVALGMLGANGIAQAMGTITRLSREAHDEATKHRTVVNQLSASLGYFSGVLIEQAEALERTNYVHAEEIMGAQQRLSLYIHEESQLQKLTPAILNLAKAKGIDLVSAANMVAVAYSRGENAANKDEAQVGRLGITFEKTGNAEKDVAALTDALNEKFGTQAKAVADSLDGWDKLGFKIGEVTKIIGLAIFGVSQNEQKFNQYNTALKAVVQEEITLNQLRGEGAKQWRLDVVQNVIDKQKEIIKNYQDEQTAAKDAAAATNKARDDEAKSADAAKKSAEARKKAIEAEIKATEDFEKAMAQAHIENDKAAEEGGDLILADEKKIADDRLALAKKLEDAKITLAKKGAESRHAVDVAEISYKIKNYDDLAKDAELSETQRTYYAQQASAQRVELIRSEAQFQMDMLDQERDAMMEQFPQIAAQIESSFAKIKQDVKAKAGIEISATLDIKIDDQKTAKEIQRCVQMWTTGISSAMSSMVSLFTAETSQEIEKAVSDIGGAIAGIGESSGSAWVAVAGEIIQGVGSIFSVLDSELDIWGNNARKVEHDRVEQLEKEHVAIVALNDRTNAWLYSIGALDLSLMSPEQLRTTMSQTAEQQLQSFGTTAGVNIERTAPSELAGAIQEFGMETVINAMKYGEGNPNYDNIIARYPGLKDLFDQMNYKNMKGDANFIKQIEQLNKIYGTGDLTIASQMQPGTAGSGNTASYAGTYAGGGAGGLGSTYNRAEQTLQGYQYTADLDHKRATSHEVFEEALSLEESQGKITALRHAQILYEMSYGLLDAIENVNYSNVTDLLGVKFMDYYGPSQRSAFKTNYETLRDAPPPATTAPSTASGFGFPGALNGGIFNTPTVISEYGQMEAAVPLDNPSRAGQILDQINNILPYSGNGGGTNITVQCLIDPNIPFSQDVARNMSAQIGELIVVSLQGKGLGR
jgi:hypothetical protein